MGWHKARIRQYTSGCHLHPHHALLYTIGSWDAAAIELAQPQISASPGTSLNSTVNGLWPLLNSLQMLFAPQRAFAPFLQMDGWGWANSDDGCYTMRLVVVRVCTSSYSMWCFALAKCVFACVYVTYVYVLGLAAVALGCHCAVVVRSSTFAGAGFEHTHTITKTP